MPEYYDYIKIYGLSSGPDECFQGLGVGGTYSIAASSTSTTSGASTEGGDESAQDEYAIQGAWEIQDEMIDLEISRLNTLLNTLAEAENLEMPDFDTEETRELVTGIIAAWMFYQKWKNIIDAVMTGVQLAFFAYDVYKRFWVEKEELRNLPGAIIELLERTINLLEKLKGLEMSRENFEFRQDMLNTMSARIDGQMDIYRAGKANAVPSESDTSDLEQALQDLQYNGEEYELINGLKVSLHGKLVGG